VWWIELCLRVLQVVNVSSIVRVFLDWRGFGRIYGGRPTLLSIYSPRWRCVSYIIVIGVSWLLALIGDFTAVVSTISMSLMGYGGPKTASSFAPPLASRPLTLLLSSRHGCPQLIAQI
jgi:hypothetical protein